MSLALIPPEMPDFQAQNAAARQAALIDLYRDRSGDPRWPWAIVHNMVGTLAPGQLFILGGYTSNGKTAICLNLARHLLLNGIPWGYAGLELNAAILTQMLAALHVGFSRRQIVDGLGLAERAVLKGAIDELRHHSDLMHFMPDASLNVDILAMRIHQLVASQKVRVIILDHLHHLDYDAADSLRRGVSRAVRVLKAAAEETGVTIVVSAQLKRETQDKAQQYRTPGLSDLAESGDVERIADVVMMAHRQMRPGTVDKLRAYQKGEPGVTEKDFALHNRVGLTLRKHRFGYQIGGTVSLHLDWPTDRLTEPTTSTPDRGDAYED